MIRTDFDRIALLPAGSFDHNAHYHGFLLNCMGPRVGEALEIGCGTGQFARLLAERADRVLGIDLSRNMIAAARRDGRANLEYEQADVFKWEWPRHRFDCIVSIATLHHLPMEAMLTRMKAALRPGGSVVVLDLCHAPRWLDAIALPWAVLLRLFHTGRLRDEPEARRLWAEHGKTDRYLSVGEARRICAAVLPGAKVRRHLLWRYSIVWRNGC